MKKLFVFLTVCAIAAVGSWGYSTFSDHETELPIQETLVVEGDAHPELLKHSELFEKQVLNPVPGVYVAVGYGLANSIMVEGDDGVFIVDVLESATEAKEVLAEFRKITEKPIEALIYTHNHTDHVFGGAIFAEGRDIPVYAHETTSQLIDRVVNVVTNAIYQRSLRMFGQLLPDEELVNAGIGPGLQFIPEEMALLRPTVTFGDRLEVEIAGVKVELVHAPGETPDQLFVWLPESKTLLPGDNVYQAFPNLYTIRGTPYRDVMKWADSIDTMRDLKPEALVPSHTLPVVDQAKIEAILTPYRDAIQYVHDQTIRRLNEGMTPDEIVEAVQLPATLREHPWLKEFYGTVDWSVRSIFDGYLGWFSGDAVDLRPLRIQDEAAKMMAAFESGSSLPEQARAALANGQYQWAAQLSRYWMRAEPEAQEPRDLLAKALTELARTDINPNARHWYFTQAHERQGTLSVPFPDPARLPDDFVADLPIDEFMAGMAVKLIAGKTGGIDQKVQFEFTDLNRNFEVHIRNQVAATREIISQNPDLTIRVSSQVWKRLATGKIGAAKAYASGEIEIDGGVVGVIRFLGLFDT